MTKKKKLNRPHICFNVLWIRVNKRNFLKLKPHSKRFGKKSVRALGFIDLHLDLAFINLPNKVFSKTSPKNTLYAVL